MRHHRHDDRPEPPAGRPDTVYRGQAPIPASIPDTPRIVRPYVDPEEELGQHVPAGYTRRY